MPEITASMVRELREKAGAGMMECKKALTAADGNIEAAFDELRKSGLKTAAKKAGRSTSEGRLAASISDDGHSGAMVSIACETDFVAKTPDFEGFLTDLCANVLANTPADVEACLAQDWPHGGSVADALAALIGKLGENILIDGVQAYSAPAGQVAFYVHHDMKKGALVSVETGSDKATAADPLRDLCMHIVVFNPDAIDRDAVDAEIVEREKTIIRENLAGKPEAIQEKIMTGQLEKFFAQRVVTEQPWIKDDKSTVGKALSTALGDGTRLTAFRRFQLGN
ncbi:MAG: translation elongation factor Ts [Planctomycetota bacterium]|nr:translation elongation factor Ts [Planctomycetota bacterium]